MAKEKTVNASCLQYAQQHLLMLLLLLLFFGVLIIPRFYEQLQHQQLKKVDGIIKTIYYSQTTPVLSFVEISYEWSGKEYLVRETLSQHVKVGDHIEIYLDIQNNSIQFQKSDVYVPFFLLLSYTIIVILCLVKLYAFFTHKK
jgi:hypothetical protein